MAGKSFPCRMYDMPIEDMEKFVNYLSSKYIEYPVTDCVGMCDPYDLFNTTACVHGGAYIITGMVFYEYKVSSKAVKYELDKMVKETLKSTGKKFISSSDKREMKAGIIERLKANSKPQPSIVPIIVGNNRAYVLTDSDKKALKFVEMMADGGFNAYFMSPYTYGDSDDGLFDMEEIGGKFLTWLWFSTESNSYKEFGGYTISPGEYIQVKGQIGECSVNGDIREARNGVFNGKDVSRFSFTLSVEPGYEPIYTVVDYLRNIKKVQANIAPSDDDADKYTDLIGLTYAADYIFDFLKVAFTEFLTHVDKSGEFSKQLSKEIWNWSRGDVCLRAFEDI